MLRLRMALFTLTVVMAFCPLTFPAGAPLPAKPAKKPAAKPAPAKPVSIEAWVSTTLSRMTLPEKVGQLIIVPFSGMPSQERARSMSELRKHIAQYHVGGMIMYRGEPRAAARLTNRLQRMARVPLIFASDFERGASHQMAAGIPFTTNMAVGATDNEAYAYFQGQVTAREARAVGIHWILAPVADVNNNPDNPIINVRSYGEDPQKVARMVGAFVRGLQENGGLATLKHFPGHGDTNVDSHIGLATIPADRRRLEDLELVPFKAGIENGAGSIMAAHVAVPQLTGKPNLPATLSEDILTSLLRKELGFTGLIVTDAMNMGGVTKKYHDDEAAVRALEAGADVVLTPPNPKLALQGVLQAVRRGRLTVQRIDESVRRLLTAKAKLGLHKVRTVRLGEAAKVFGEETYRAKAQEIADRSLTLLRHEDRILPIRPAQARTLLSILVNDEKKGSAGDIFQRALQRRAPGLKTATLHGQSSDAEIAALLEEAGQADVLICASYVQVRASKGTVALPEKPASIISRILQTGKPVLVVAFGSPYVIRQFSQTRNYLLTYSLTETAQLAAAKAIFGEIEISGKLPITIPGLFAIGSGLSLFKRDGQDRQD